MLTHTARRLAAQEDDHKHKIQASSTAATLRGLTPVKEDVLAELDTPERFSICPNPARIQSMSTRIHIKRSSDSIAPQSTSYQQIWSAGQILRGYDRHVIIILKDNPSPL